jgi:hypothetical protein
MKRFTSVLVLCGIFLSSFLVQEANAANWKNSATIHAEGQQQGNHSCHKSLIFSEIENESEDSEQKFSSEFQFDDYQNIISENKYIKNILSVFSFTYYSSYIPKTTTPVFIINRSIRI